jgi:hypothetical protein
MDSMAPLSLDDARTLQAIGILADVLDGQAGTGAIDTVLVSKALRQVIATKSQPAFEFATRAFNTLDPAVRRQVADGANHAARGAMEVRNRTVGFLNTPPRKATTSAGAVSGPSLMTAINLRRRKRTLP